MAGGPITGTLPVKRTYKNYPDAILRKQASMQSQGPSGRYPVSATNLMGPPTSVMGKESISIDDGFMDALKEMSPDLMAKYEAEDVAPKGAFVGSKIPWSSGGDWVTPPPSMAPWLKKKRVT
jgi:hypothetical protein